MSRPLAYRIAASFLVALGAVGCATMLELDGYDEAIELICQCPGFEKVSTCVSSANKRLDFAGESEQKAWLADYDTKQCGVVCDRAAECYGNVPACQEKRVGCECCTWKNGELSCATSLCETCSTCFEQATQQIGAAAACVSGKALLGDLERCACGTCSNECKSFCQGTGQLPSNGSNACTMCLEGACKLALDACTADKP